MESFWAYITKIIYKFIVYARAAARKGKKKKKEEKKSHLNDNKSSF